MVFEKWFKMGGHKIVYFQPYFKLENRLKKTPNAVRRPEFRTATRA